MSILEKLIKFHGAESYFELEFSTSSGVGNGIDLDENEVGSISPAVNNGESQPIRMSKEQKSRPASQRPIVDWELQARTALRQLYRRRAMGEIELKNDIEKLYGVLAMKDCNIM